MSRRNRLEIIYDILTAIYKGKHKITHIMYTVNTGNTILNKYLKVLIDCEAIIYAKKGYHITLKGEDMMILYSKLKGFLPY